MTWIERILAASAAIVTLGNAFLAWPSFATEGVSPLVSIFQAFDLQSRVVLVLVLEISLAYAFAMLYTLVSTIENKMAAVVLFTVVAGVSAWVTFFNLEYILVGSTLEDDGDIIKFGILLLPVAIVACGFILYHHVFVHDKRIPWIGTKPILSDYLYMAPGIQAGLFILLYISMFFR